MLDVSQDRNVLYLRVPVPVRPGRDSERLAWELIDGCQQIRESDERPVAVALIGLGDAFCIEPPRSAADCDAAGAEWREATSALAGLAPPTIAALGGDTIGLAFELALACDLTVADESTHLGAPEVRFGRMPSAGGSQRLARAVGRAVALRMLLLGEQLTVTEAMRLGLVHRVARAGQLEPALEELLDELRPGAPIALAYTKEAIRTGSELPLASGLTLEADLAALLQTTADRSEGIRAFSERSTPRFEGR